MKKKILENFLRSGLSILLNLNFLSSVFVSYINPESYFFGEKLIGANATIYLLAGGIAGIIIVFFLFKKKSMGIILSLLFFGYFFIEGLMTNLSLGFGFDTSPFPKVGLSLSIILLVIERMVH